MFDTSICTDDIYTFLRMQCFLTMVNSVLAGKVILEAETLAPYHLLLIGGWKRV